MFGIYDSPKTPYKTLKLKEFSQSLKSWISDRESSNLISSIKEFYESSYVIPTTFKHKKIFDRTFNNLDVLSTVLNKLRLCKGFETVTYCSKIPSAISVGIMSKNGSLKISSFSDGTLYLVFQIGFASSLSLNILPRSLELTVNEEGDEYIENLVRTLTVLSCI